MAKKIETKKDDSDILKTEVERDVKGKTKIRRFFRAVGKFFKIITLSILATVGGAILVLFVLGYSLYATYAQGYKQAKKRSNSTQVVFYDKTGAVIYESYGAKTPDAVKLSEVPEVVISATLAAEDNEFYKHGAIDPKGILRATLLNIRSSEKPGLGKLTDLFSENNYSQGGSSITQQLVKNIYLTNEKSFDRKLKEVIYAIQVENNQSKDKTLEDYLNNVYYGEQSLGVKNAAKTYFNKDISELNLAEASMLAGLPVAPTKLSPISGDYEEAKKRQEYVLSRMVQSNRIGLEEAKTAANEPLAFSTQSEDLVIKYPYFVDFVKKELAEKVGEDSVERGGFEVYTTLDPKIQESAETITKDYITKKYTSRKVSNSASVVLDNKTLGISGMVGGVDWEKSKVNVATSQRQPGSSFKPIVYMAGLLDGYTASSMFADKYVNFGGSPAYVPKNYDGSYHGTITMRTALSNSFNIPAVEMAKLVGVDKVKETAKKLGISTISENRTYGLTIGLGSAEVELFELARAYSVFANQGKLASYSGIEKIIDGEGTEIYARKAIGTSVIDEKLAYIMTSILSDNKSRSLVFGSNSPLFLKDRPVAAKTGTTDDYADSWTMGYTPQYTVGVWMGNNDRTVMARVSGVEGAAYIWNDIMKSIHKDLPVEQFIKPTGLTELWINPRTGLPATTQTAPNILEYFMPGTEPKKDQKFDYLKQFGK